jgi:membrane-associated phospholipid phosphatase
MTTTFRTWLASLLSTAAIVWVSIRWLDRPIALWVHDIHGERVLPTGLAESPVSSIAAVPALAFFLCGLIAIMGRRFSKPETVIAMSAISALAAIISKDQLKLVFGRTWPDTWGPGIVSFVRNGVYGFHFFHSGKSFESFPSGHATIAAAILSVLCILVPKLRVPCVICMFAVDIGLVALNVHFLSDTIAGTFVGFSTALFTAALWRAMSGELAQPT